MKERVAAEAEEAARPSSRERSYSDMRTPEPRNPRRVDSIEGRRSIGITVDMECVRHF